MSSAEQKIESLVDIESLRPRLFGIAYRMLGSVADAEDAVQETFLRWELAQSHSTRIQAPEGWLVSVVTRYCIDQLRSARVQRETYIGQWLPEPIATESASDVGEIAESLSLAFLVLLEKLNPVERAVFLLHDVFAYSFGEIATILERSEPSCRQSAKRARDRIEDGRPRYEVPLSEGQRIAAEFLRASVDGDLPALLALVTEDVVMVADGGGKVAAVTKPVQGAATVTKMVAAFVPRIPPGWTASPAIINAGPGIITRDAAGKPFAIMSFEITDGRIAAIRIVSNPDKFHGIPEA
jgi:RNA polymerase sigma-70 factor (ECF subfamily)